MDDQEIGEIAAETAREETIALLRKNPKTNPPSFVNYLIKSLKDKHSRLSALNLLADIYELKPNRVNRHQISGQNGQPIKVTFVEDFGIKK